MNWMAPSNCGMISVVTSSTRAQRMYSMPWPENTFGHSVVALRMKLRWRIQHQERNIKPENGKEDARTTPYSKNVEYSTVCWAYGSGKIEMRHNLAWQNNVAQSSGNRCRLWSNQYWIASCKIFKRIFKRTFVSLMSKLFKWNSIWRFSTLKNEYWWRRRISLRVICQERAISICS